MMTAKCKKQSEVNPIKRRLEAYHQLDEYIRNQEERLARLEYKMYNLSSQVISDMPKAPSTTFDRTGAMVAQHDELETKITGLKEKREAEWACFESILSHMNKANEKTVIECRYHDGEKWKDIAEIIFGSKEDFDEKELSYERTCMRIHGEALIEMARIEKSIRK